MFSALKAFIPKCCLTVTSGAPPMHRRSIVVVTNGRILILAAIYGRPQTKSRHRSIANPRCSSVFNRPTCDSKVVLIFVISERPIRFFASVTGNDRPITSRFLDSSLLGDPSDLFVCILMFRVCATFPMRWNSSPLFISYIFFKSAYEFSLTKPQWNRHTEIVFL